MNPLPLPLLRLLLVSPLLAVAGAFITMGSLVVVRDSALVLRARTLSWLITVPTLSLVLATIVFFLATREPSVCVLLLLPALIIFVAWRSMRGYFMIAVTEADVRASLQAALGELDLPFEESILGFSLVSLGDNLQVRVHPQLGVAQLGMARAGQSPELDRIAASARSFLRRDRDAYVPTAVGLAVAGLVLLLLSIYQARRF
jgi:hypothetical protein